LHLTIWFTSSGQGIIVRDDITNVSEDVSVKIPILQNDYAQVKDPFDTSTLFIHRQSLNGLAHVGMREAFVLYQPHVDFEGVDSFVYRICTFGGVCQEGNVQVYVHAVNDRPVAMQDLDSVLEDQVRVLDVLANDLDADDTTFSEHDVRIVQEPRFGYGRVDGQRIEYRPKENFHGVDMLKYALCDDQFCDTTSVKIIVLPVNDAPIAIDDKDTTIQNLLAVIDPLANDIDTVDLVGLDRKSLQVKDILQASHGETFVDTSVGMIVYIPETDFVGVDSFSYRICDLGPNPVLCDTAMIYIWVEPLSSLVVANKGGELTSQRPELRSKVTIKGHVVKESHLMALKHALSQIGLRPGSYSYKSTDGEIRLVRFP